MNKLFTKQSIIVGVAALLIGVILTGGFLYKAAPGLMMFEDESKYGFEETLEKFEAEVKDAGWKVAGIHDMQKILKDYGYDVKAVKIYELCSSKYSAEILEKDDERIVSPLMPCSIAIYEKSDGKTYISRMNSSLIAKPFGGTINDIMQQASDDTEKIIDKLVK